MVLEKQEETDWLLCPVCKHKTRIKLRQDTEMKNFLLFCPKCKKEILIDVKGYRISVVRQLNNVARR